jgi:hypothetical protein
LFGWTYGVKLLEQFFRLLNGYAGAVQAVSTVVLVIITVRYVLLTEALADAATAELQNQARAANARRQELQANIKFLLDTLFSLPIWSDTNALDSGGVVLA